MSRFFGGQNTDLPSRPRQPKVDPQRETSRGPIAQRLEQGTHNS